MGLVCVGYAALSSHDFTSSTIGDNDAQAIARNGGLFNGEQRRQKALGTASRSRQGGGSKDRTSREKGSREKGSREKESRERGPRDKKAATR